MPNTFRRDKQSGQKQGTDAGRSVSLVVICRKFGPELR
jgi:hypothetical protein